MDRPRQPPFEPHYTCVIPVRDGEVHQAIRFRDPVRFAENAGEGWDPGDPFQAAALLHGVVARLERKQERP